MRLCREETGALSLRQSQPPPEQKNCSGAGDAPWAPAEKLSYCWRKNIAQRAVGFRVCRRGHEEKSKKDVECLGCFVCGYWCADFFFWLVGS